MIPNLIGVLAMSPLVLKLTNNYVARRIHGESVKPMLSYNSDIEADGIRAIEEDGVD